MSNVLNKTTLQYLTSVNEVDYPLIDWIHEPDMSAVSGVLPRYWKLVGSAPVEMTQGEKDAKDAAIETARLDAVEAFLDDHTSPQGAYNVLLYKEINKLRVKDGDSPYTVNQLKNALRNEAS